MTRASKQRYVPIHLVEKLDLKLPFWRYFELYRREPYAFLLDSAKDPRKLGRFSFIGGNPFLVFKAKRIKSDPQRRANIAILDRAGGGEGSVVRYEGEPFDEIRQLLIAHTVGRDEYAGYPTPLLAGAVGYFGYESAYFIESLPDIGVDDLKLPDICLMFVNSLLAHCHRTGMTYLSVLGRGPNELVARARAVRTRDHVLHRIEQFERGPGAGWEGPPAGAKRAKVHVSGLFDERGYGDLVLRMREHIYAGDIFEGCLTHRLEAPYAGDPWMLYQELRRINPAPFACYLNLPEAQIVSSSPERFLRLGADRIAESRPIKGTRRRGATAEEDKAAHASLATSPKDAAENNMIVDLVRNDFGRVCRFGTVHVPELRIIEQYATVYQMVSTIRGHLDEGRDAIDLITSCFPGGSMTGAPKIEAMKIIDRLEPVKRGVYSGAIGYLDFSGALDLNIVIRTLIVKDKKAFFNVGGAVLADSDPKAEYEETVDKSRALVNALENMGEAPP